MNISKKKKYGNIISYLVMAVFIAIAISPVLYSSNYIRQDDLMWEIWPWMKPSEFGYLYYNTVFQLFRPICMLSFYITDLVAISIHNAVYVRAFSLAILIFLSIMVYHWQLLFNKNKPLAVAFSICTFTLPAYQVFAATANYELILTALVMTIAGGFFLYFANATNDEKRWKKYLILGSILIYASMLNYPLSTMFIWAMLVIAYCNCITNTVENRAEKISFIAKTFILTIGLMCLYYATSRLIHIIFHVRLDSSRVAVIDTTHILSRFSWIVDAASWHSYFWMWDNTNPIIQSPFKYIFLSTSIGLLITHVKNGYKGIFPLLMDYLFSISILAVLFFMSYSPILATNEYVITYRYALVTMPILLYLTLWSLTIITKLIASFSPFFNKLITIIYPISLLTLSVYAVYAANTRLSDGIVGPHDNDFSYIQAQLSEKVIPLLQSNKKVLIHAIACDDGINRYGDGLPTSFEYGMRTCQYQQQVIGVIVHSLRLFGYPSNYNKHNEVVYNDNEIILQNTPWGTLLVNSPVNQQIDENYYKKNGYTIITIDTRNTPIYQKNDLYRKLYKRVTS